MKIKKMFLLSVFLMIGVLLFMSIDTFAYEGNYDGEVIIEGNTYAYKKQNKTAAIVEGIKNNDNQIIFADYIVVDGETYEVTEIVFMKDIIGAGMNEAGTEYVKLPRSITKIPGLKPYAGLFGGDMINLTKVDMPDTITEMGYGTFLGTRKLRNITLPSSLTVLGEAAFKASGIREIVIPDGVKKIEAETFSDCIYLQSIALPSNLTYIATDAFTGSGVYKEGGTIDFADISQLKFFKTITTLNIDSSRLKLKVDGIDLNVLKSDGDITYFSRKIDANTMIYTKYSFADNTEQSFEVKYNLDNIGFDDKIDVYLNQGKITAKLVAKKEYNNTLPKTIKVNGKVLNKGGDNYKIDGTITIPYSDLPDNGGTITIEAGVYKYSFISGSDEVVDPIVFEKEFNDNGVPRDIEITLPSIGNKPDFIFGCWKGEDGYPIKGGTSLTRSYFFDEIFFAQWRKEVDYLEIDFTNPDNGQVNEDEDVANTLLMDLGIIILARENGNHCIFYVNPNDETNTKKMVAYQNGGELVYADGLTINDNFVILSDKLSELDQNWRDGFLLHSCDSIPTKGIKVIVSNTPAKYKVSINKPEGLESAKIKGETINGIVNIATYGNYDVELAVKDGYVIKSVKVNEQEVALKDNNIITLENVKEDKNIVVETERVYSYTFITGDNQKFTLNKIDKYSFKVDGDYKLFSKVVIGKLNLEKDVDYKVEEGSTIITFTDKGLAKLNTLAVGTYDVVVEYTNNNKVTGKLIIEADKTATGGETGGNADVNTGNTGSTSTGTGNTDSDKPTGSNPQTGDNIILFVAILLVAVLGIVITTKVRKNIKK